MFLSNRGSFRPETSGAYTLRRRGRRRPKSGSAIGACAVARLAGSGGPIGDYYGSANKGAGGDDRLGSGRLLRQRLGEVPGAHHVHVVLRARDADDPREELQPEPLVEEQLHEHADGEAHRVLVVAFQPRSRLSQGGIRVRGEPAAGELVARGPVVDEGEEALDLADELIEVALLGDDERVQLILLEGAVRQRRQKLPRIFPPREPFRELPQLGRAHAHDGGRVDVRDELRLERPVPLIRMGGEKRPDIFPNRHRSPFSALSPGLVANQLDTPPTAEEKDRQPSLPARPPIPCVEARAQQRGSYHSSIIAEPSLYFGNRAFLVRFSMFAISRFQKSMFSK